MPAYGSQRWEWTGPSLRPKKKRAVLPRADPRTARHVMGTTRPKKSISQEAKKQRKMTSRWSECEKIAQSQRKVTQNALKKATYYGPNAAEVRLEAAGLPGMVPDFYGEGTAVKFLPPGPRRARALACGFLLRTIGARWAVVDRRQRGQALKLKNIFCVPIWDCWLATIRPLVR